MAGIIPSSPDLQKYERQRAHQQAVARRQTKVGNRTPAPGFGAPSFLNPGGKLGRAVSGKDPASLKLNVLGLQHFLRNKGYNIKTDGNLGPLTKQALKDAIISGVITHASAAQMQAVKGVRGGDIGPKAFNHMVSTAGTAPYRPLIGKNAKGQIQPNGSLGNPGPGGNGQGMNVNPNSTQQALKGAGGQSIDPNVANFGQLFNVDQTAQAMAQQQFQPQINESQLALNRDPRQAAQNEQDVKDWYNQVIAAQGKAAGADKLATQQGVDATNAQTQALVQSLGGSANQGSGDVAAAGQNGANTLQAIGASQAGLDAELAPILQAQQAQAQRSQSNLDLAQQQSDRLALENLQGQEGNAQTSAQQQLMSANNSLDQSRQAALQQILEYNNSLKQQKYQNQLGLMNAQIAAAMNGVSMAKTQAQTRYYNARAAGGGHGMSPSQLNEIQRSLLGALGSKGLIVGGNGQPFKLAPGVKPSQVLAFGQNFEHGYGNVPGGFLGSALSGIQGY